MDNVKTPEYYLNKIINDIEFTIKKTEDVTYEEFIHDEIVNSAISFKFIQISENSKRLPKSLTDRYPDIPWFKMNGMRNKIVHDYGNVQLDIIYDTIKNDLPILLTHLKNIK